MLNLFPIFNFNLNIFLRIFTLFRFCCSFLSAGRVSWKRNHWWQIRIYDGYLLERFPKFLKKLFLISWHQKFEHWHIEDNLWRNISFSSFYRIWSLLKSEFQQHAIFNSFSYLIVFYITELENRTPKSWAGPNGPQNVQCRVGFKRRTQTNLSLWP